MQDNSGIVDLNVGGSFYTTSISTLACDKDSMLASMFGGNFDVQKRHDGRVFIDRDGEVFKFILQYLRDGELDVDYLDELTKRRLLKEASYYCISGIETLLKASLEYTPLKPREQEGKKRFVYFGYCGGEDLIRALKSVFPNSEVQKSSNSSEIELIFETFFDNNYSLHSHIATIQNDSQYDQFIFKLNST
eukprot:TRINITY_DN7198_c0_g1_i1.p1 TRINITY_DN7198_c0_g1~~TRINITY_DN7198_c0_g1_i1.p1  ORF type:complete len:191 (+),score=45.46 TRINITY_DN7198_c0_g1_i1:497-1069(+)